MIGAALGARHAATEPGAAAPMHLALFLIHDLRSGGAERVFLNYVNNLARFRPVAIVVRAIEEVLDELSPAVPLYDLAHPVERGAPAGGVRDADLFERGVLVVEGELAGALPVRAAARAKRTSFQSSVAM